MLNCASPGIVALNKKTADEHTKFTRRTVRVSLCTHNKQDGNNNNNINNNNTNNTTIYKAP